MEPTSRRITGSQGLDLHLLEWSQEGVPMILVHGFGNEAHIWQDFAQEVAGYYRVLGLDQRGHGDSGWPLHGEYEYPHFMADLDAVLENLSVERAVLVGHSLGGRVCMLYAGAHPEKVAGLVIVDSAPELGRSWHHAHPDGCRATSRSQFRECFGIRTNAAAQLPRCSARGYPAHGTAQSQTTRRRTLDSQDGSGTSGGRRDHRNPGRPDRTRKGHDPISLGCSGEGDLPEPGRSRSRLGHRLGGRHGSDGRDPGRPIAAGGHCARWTFRDDR